MKTLIISHKADIDGLSPVIFLKLFRKDVDVCLLNANDIIPKVKELTSSKEYLKYDEIFITDLTLDRHSCELIMQTREHKRFHTFDHHIFNLVANEYPFGVSISTNESGINECATSLFYKYLIHTYPEEFDLYSIAEYTELVRQSDTWDWAKTNNQRAQDLAELLSILGREKYIEFFVNYLKGNNNHFDFTPEHKYLLEVEKERVQRYLEESEKTMFHATLNGHKCGIVFAESNRSLLGNYLCEKYKHAIDFVIIINMQQGISFRAQKDDINVSEIAKIYGGGGHIKASGAPMDNSLKKEVIKYILNNENLFN